MESSEFFPFFVIAISPRPYGKTYASSFARENALANCPLSSCPRQSLIDSRTDLGNACFNFRTNWSRPADGFRSDSSERKDTLSAILFYNNHVSSRVSSDVSRGPKVPPILCQTSLRSYRSLKALSDLNCSFIVSTPITPFLGNHVSPNARVASVISRKISECIGARWKCAHIAR